jgi:hypothetical protein
LTSCWSTGKTENGLSIIFETQFMSKIVLQEYSAVRGEGGIGAAL